jgi:hypothetical protein
VVHGTVRSLFQLLGAIGMTILVLAAWLGYRLSEAPISLSFLTPYIEDALAGPEGGLGVKLERTVLVWDRGTRTLQIRADGIRVTAGDNGVIASVPEMSLALSGAALLRGAVVLRRVSLIHPTIRLLRDTHGHIQLGVGEPGQVSAAPAPQLTEALQSLLATPGEDSAIGHLQRLDIVQGELAIEDEALGIRWHAPEADVRLARNEQGIIGHARVELRLAGESARFEADGDYRIAGREGNVTASFRGIRPSLFAALVPQLQALAALQLPVGGSVSVHYCVDRGLCDIRFDLAGEQGVIDGRSWHGLVWAVQSAAMRGSLTADSLSLDDVRVDLGGPVIALAGKADGLRLLGGSQPASPVSMEAQARLEGVPVDDLKRLWPPELAPNPRGWIVANLSQGRVRVATAKVSAHVPAGRPIDDLVIDDIGGEVVPEGVTVNYLAPMTPVRNASAVATYDANAFVLDIRGGEVMGLRVTEGKVGFGGLSSPDQVADIDLSISGPVADALRLIDNKPLGYAKALGISPSHTSGDAVTRLTLKFPLLARLSLNQMKVQAHSKISRFAMPNVLLNLDLSDADLVLDVDTKALDAVGKAKLGGQAVSVSWRENFAKAAFRSRYHVVGGLDDAARRLAGLDAAPFQPPFLSGAVPVDMTATLADTGGEIDVKADLTPAVMLLPGLNWEKRAGMAGQVSALVHLAGGRLDAVPRFSVNSADGLDIQGQVGFAGGRVQSVVFRKAKWGRTDVKGSLTVKPGDSGLALDISGPVFDARELVSGEPSDHKTDKAPEKHGKARAANREAEKRKDDLVPLDVHAKLDQVWVSDNGTVKNVAASLIRGRRDWHTVAIDATVGGNKPLKIEIQPSAKDRRTLKVTSGDAGAVFRSLGIFDNVVGGELTVDGTYDDADPRQRLTGLATVSDYNVVKAPALARLLTVAALTGIADLLTGQGIYFTNLEAPFTLTDGVLDLHDARASGTSLGITAKGQMDLDNDTVALEGTVVPFYLFNSALGRLPVLGNVLTGEKGGGVFAINYSMKGPSADPSVTVNPLSALTPGVLRRLFNLFDDGTGTEVRPPEKATSPAN